MTLFYYFSLSIIVIYIAVQFFQLCLLIKYKPLKYKKFQENELPKISIWVACRNEEKNIGACLNALLALDYPENLVQILVGDDQSTDKTRDIILAYCKKHPQIELIDIIEDTSNLKAKARVMAQIDKKAVGDFYLITDADVEVKPSWAKGLIEFLSDDMGVASGLTMVKCNTLDGKMQEIDWTYFMGLIYAITYQGVPATAVGNNMIVKRQAYEDTGGYGEIQFSITEDYKLYSEICAKGWRWNNIMHPDVLAYSKKTTGFKSLMHQRKRWLSGGKELPWYWWVLFGIYAGFFFFIPVIFVLNLKIGLTLWALKFIIQAIQIKSIYSHIQEKMPNLGTLIIYEFYLFIVTISTAIFVALPIKTKWKERKY